MKASLAAPCILEDEAEEEEVGEEEEKCAFKRNFLISSTDSHFAISNFSKF